MSELVGPGNVKHPKIRHGNSGRIAMGLRRYIAEKGVGRWKIIDEIQGDLKKKLVISAVSRSA